MRNFHQQMYWFWTGVWDAAPSWDWLLNLIYIPRDYHRERGWPEGGY